MKESLNDEEPNNQPETLPQQLFVLQTQQGTYSVLLTYILSSPVHYNTGRGHLLAEAVQIPYHEGVTM